MLNEAVEHDGEEANSTTDIEAVKWRYCKE